MEDFPPPNNQNRNLQLQEIICQRCHLEPTGGSDSERVCQICKALGKTSESQIETTFWEDIRLGIRCAGKYLFGLKS
jgi:hypothetical protein